MIRKAIIVVLTAGAAATAVLWAASLFTAWQWRTWRFDGKGELDLRPGRHTTFRFSDGALRLMCWYETDIDGPYADAYLDWGVLHVLLFSTAYENKQGAVMKQTQVAKIRIELWAPFVILAAYPTLAFFRGPLRRYRRRRKGLCVKCAYDLTGNVSGVCPECGTEVKQA
jgi:hypothetical protein